MFRKILFFLFVLGLYQSSIMAQTNGCLDVLINQINPTCFGGDDGAIELTPQNGVPPYTYNINGISGGPFTGSTTYGDLPVGTYSIVVMDADTCDGDFFVIIVEPAHLDVVTILATDATCGDANGSITVDVAGGTGLLTYQWDTSTGNQTTSTATGLVAGTYTVIVTDENGCTAATTVVINDSPGPGVILVVTNVSCNGDTDGTIQAVVNDPGPLTYNWGNGLPPVATITDIPSGNYCVTVVIGNNCETTACADLLEPSEIIVDISITNPSVGNDGQIVATVTGGTSPYTFDWSNGSTAPLITGLSPGTYSLTVSDANGCVGFVNDIVLQTFDFDIVTTDVDCNGDNTGSIQLIPNTATPPFTFSWNGPSGFSATEQNINNLFAGTYTVIIVDGNSETISYTITILENSPMVVSVGFPALCSGDPLMVNLSVTGGTPPYTFDWGGLNPDDLPAGSFTVTITDANACELIYSDMVADPAPIDIVLTTTNPTCNGANGCIDLTVTGGTPPYDYLWSIGTTTEDICGLAEGTYNVSVIDANNCEAVKDIILIAIGGPVITLMGFSCCL